jgi:hypothetical protein
MTIFEKVFEKELELFGDQSLKESVINIGNRVPIYNLIGPSSSSGKYHNIADNGLSGNVYHTKSVLFCILVLSASLREYDTPEEKDILIASALLHDLFKYNEGEFHTSFDHPIKIGKLIREESRKGNKIKLERIAKIVEAHMSRWSTNEKYAPGIKLSEPSNLEERLLSFADMIGSSKDITIDLNATYRN